MMRTLKELIQDWLNSHDKAQIARLSYFKQRADIMYQITEIRLQRVYTVTSDMSEDDKEVINEFYEHRIERLNQELYWLDIFYDLKIKEDGNTKNTG